MLDTHKDAALDFLARQLDHELLMQPGCAYKIVGLFGCAGEANLFQKHFAYFVPEDEGIKYASTKRTIVFANVYRAMYERLFLPQLDIFGWSERKVPSAADALDYLIPWFRGHDLGHSVVKRETNFRQLSQLDRWGSMVLQEALADVFGVPMCTQPKIAAELALDPEKLSRGYMLEMLRYLRRGPLHFPGAGAAFIQLKFLLEMGCYRWSSREKLEFHYELFYPSLTALAKALRDNVLSGDPGRAATFLDDYSPTRNQDEAHDFMSELGVLADTFSYSQVVTEA